MKEGFAPLAQRFSVDKQTVSKEEAAVCKFIVGFVMVAAGVVIIPVAIFAIHSKPLATRVELLGSGSVLLFIGAALWICAVMEAKERIRKGH